MPIQGDPTKPTDGGEPATGTATSTRTSSVGQVKKKATMNHGQFYKADELVELIHQNFDGFHPGARGVHANGRI